MKKEDGKERVRRWFPDPRPWREKLDAGVLGTVADAAGALNLPPSFIYGHWKEIPGARKIGKYIRFDLRELTKS